MKNNTRYIEFPIKQSDHDSIWNNPNISDDDLIKVTHSIPPTRIQTIIEDNSFFNVFAKLTNYTGCYSPQIHHMRTDKDIEEFNKLDNRSVYAQPCVVPNQSTQYNHDALALAFGTGLQTTSALQLVKDRYDGFHSKPIIKLNLSGVHVESTELSTNYLVSKAGYHGIFESVSTTINDITQKSILDSMALGRSWQELSPNQQYKIYHYGDNSPFNAVSLSKLKNNYPNVITATTAALTLSVASIIAENNQGISGSNRIFDILPYIGLTSLVGLVPANIYMRNLISIQRAKKQFDSNLTQNQVSVREKINLPPSTTIVTTHLQDPQPCIRVESSGLLSRTVVEWNV